MSSSPRVHLERHGARLAGGAEVEAEEVPELDVRVNARLVDVLLEQHPASVPALVQLPGGERILRGGEDLAAGEGARRDCERSRHTSETSRHGPEVYTGSSDKSADFPQTLHLPAWSRD
jgi:hypothetical protein